MRSPAESPGRLDEEAKLGVVYVVGMQSSARIGQSRAEGLPEWTENAYFPSLKKKVPHV